MLRGVQRSQVVRLLQVMPNDNHSCMQIFFTTLHCLVLKQCRVALIICTEAGNVCLIESCNEDWRCILTRRRLSDHRPCALPKDTVHHCYQTGLQTKEVVQDGCAA